MLLAQQLVAVDHIDVDQGNALDDREGAGAGKIGLVALVVVRFIGGEQPVRPAVGFPLQVQFCMFEKQALDDHNTVEHPVEIQVQLHGSDRGHILVTGPGGILETDILNPDFGLPGQLIAQRSGNGQGTARGFLNLLRDDLLHILLVEGCQVDRHAAREDDNQPQKGQQGNLQNAHVCRSYQDARSRSTSTSRSSK